MAGIPGRSGGHNRIDPAEHVIRGTFRSDRHLPKPEPASPPVSAAARKRTLAGLSFEARRIAAALLDEYQGWDESSLHTLRLYALSCERLAALQAAGDVDTRPLHREMRIHLQLVKALNLEGPK